MAHSGQGLLLVALRAPLRLAQRAGRDVPRAQHQVGHAGRAQLLRRLHSSRARGQLCRHVDFLSQQGGYVDGGGQLYRHRASRPRGCLGPCTSAVLGEGGRGRGGLGGQPLLAHGVGQRVLPRPRHGLHVAVLGAGEALPCAQLPPVQFTCSGHVQAGKGCRRVKRVPRGALVGAQLRVLLVAHVVCPRACASARMSQQLQAGAEKEHAAGEC